MKDHAPLAARTDSNVEDFVTFWQQTFDKPGQVEWWTHYLRRFAG